jgi:AraC-like DNA-binding protein
MDQIVRLDQVDAYNRMRGVVTRHPLVTVLDLSKAEVMPARTFRFGLYAVFLKELVCGELSYGRSHYDYQEGTLVFVGPGQVLGVQPKVQTFQPKGWALLFHPDLIKGTPLGRQIQQYSFFSYSVNEALHLSEGERQTVLECFRKVSDELNNPVDRHTRTLITTSILLLLDYCQRYYERQFITREDAHRGTLQRFESLLNEYLGSDVPMDSGLPTVAYFAERLHLSTNYFGDLIRRESGVSAQSFIQERLIETAKERMFDPEASISEIAYGLGFRYPQHFTRLFRQKVGMPPNEYRQAIGN